MDKVERYLHDPMFHNLVDNFAGMLFQNRRNIEPSMMREALEVAIDKVFDKLREEAEL